LRKLEKSFKTQFNHLFLYFTYFHNLLLHVASAYVHARDALNVLHATLIAYIFFKQQLILDTNYQA